MSITSYLDHHSPEEIALALTEYRDSLLPEDPDRQQIERTTPQEYVGSYQKMVERWTQEVPGLIQRFNQWVDTNHFTLSQSITPALPLVFYDWNIAHALGVADDPPSYSHLDSLITSFYSESTTVLSQLATIASYNKSAQTVGYTHLDSESSVQSATPESNQWFNGGVNLITQEHLSTPEEFHPFVEQQKSSAHLHWFTQRIVQEIKVPEQIVLAGYFSAGEEREQVRTAIHHRFGVSLEDLRYFYPLPITSEIRQTTEDILAGKAVILEYPKSNQDLEQLYTKTAAIFPNVEARAV